MDFKHFSWIFIAIGILTHIFGLLKCIAFIICLILFIIGCLCAVYIQRGNLDEFLNDNSNMKNPLENNQQIKRLGLNLVCDRKPIVLISPNIRIQTDRELRKKQKISNRYHHQQEQQQQQHQLCDFYSSNNFGDNKSNLINISQQHYASSTSCIPSMVNLETGSDIKKRSLIDTSIELLFKKHGGKHNFKNVQQQQQKMKLFNNDIDVDKTNQNLNDSVINLNKSNGTGGNHYRQQHAHDDHKKWKPFENIKIYTEKKKLFSSSSSSSSSSATNNQSDKLETEQIQYGEDCTSTNHGVPSLSSAATSANNGPNINDNPIPYKYFVTLSNDAHLLDEHGSPKKKQLTMLSGNKQIDQLLHKIIDYIIRDFIDSWFCSLSDNKEFSDYRVRNCIEECVMNICQRIKNTEWIPLMTTKLIDDLTQHTRLYRNAKQSINEQKIEINTKMNNLHYDKLSPQRKNNKKISQQHHKRNKSDTDLEWYMSSGNDGTQKNVANSKFYTENKNDETITSDPEISLLNAFFQQNNLFQNECTNEQELEKYLTHVMETILYFTLPEEDFACIPLRTFLSTLLANVIFKPLLEMLSDPDFINLQVAKLFAKEPPPVEYFLRALRQSTDLSELRACRQLIIQEMSSKFHESIHTGNSTANTSSNATTTSGNTLLNQNAELSSLKYAQKLIDIRISYLQNSNDCLDSLLINDNNSTITSDKYTKLPTLSLDELLFKELARSYFLDYLSVLNLQKYVIFYLTVDEWKCLMNQTLVDIQANKLKASKDEILKTLRDKAQNICKEYLTPGSQNYLTIDQGLIDAILFKVNSPNITPDFTWFDSIMKYIYEKLKNEDVFLPQFYQSSGYKKLLLELEVYGQNQEPLYIDNYNLQNYSETGSDTNSGDINFDEELTVYDGNTIIMKSSTDTQLPKPDLLDIVGYKHSRSHSDCTGIIANNNYCDINLLSTTIKKDQIKMYIGSEQNFSDSEIDSDKIQIHGSSSISDQTTIADRSNVVIDQTQERARSAPSRTTSTAVVAASLSVVDSLKTSSGTSLSTKPSSTNNTEIPTICLESKPKLTARIINTAILSEGQYAVYAIHVCVIEDNQEKSWHIYRRYSKFLELKKLLTKRYPAVAKIPFPAKKAFQNTQRAVLEHRMDLLNEFLRYICAWSEDNYEMMRMIRAFLEPDTDDRKIHGGTVIRTIEHIVNPLKTGMRTIRNMPDTLVGGFSRILLGKGPLKEPSFLEVNNLEQSSEYPPLTSAIHLLDEIFDLQARSQWLRRGLINRVLGAPWVSHTANKKIIHAAKSIIEVEKIELVLSTILNTIWPNGKQQKRSIPREDNTKLRTRIAAKMALFALVFDDLKRIVGSETTRSGLLNSFDMWQHKKLNLRLLLILMNDVLTTLYRVESMTKHCKD